MTSWVWPRCRVWSMDPGHHDPGGGPGGPGRGRGGRGRATARGNLRAEQARAVADQVALLATERVSAHDQDRAEAFLLGEAAHARHADDPAGSWSGDLGTSRPLGFAGLRGPVTRSPRSPRRSQDHPVDGHAGGGLTHGRVAIPTAVPMLCASSPTRGPSPSTYAPRTVPGPTTGRHRRPSGWGQAFAERINDPTGLPDIGAGPPPWSRSVTTRSSRARSRPPRWRPARGSAAPTSSRWPVSRCDPGLDERLW